MARLPARREVKLSAPGREKVAVTAAANLDVHGNDALRLLRYDEKPYWDIERARIGTPREVPVELIVNGQRGRAEPRSRRQDPDAQLRRRD